MTQLGPSQETLQGKYLGNISFFTKVGTFFKLSFLCLCTPNLKLSDLFGQTNLCLKNEISEINEILKFIPGFLVEAIKQGKAVVLDSINEVNATVVERLNGLFDKKNNEN